MSFSYFLKAAFGHEVGGGGGVWEGSAPSRFLIYLEFVDHVTMRYSRKNQKKSSKKRGGWGYTFLKKKPGIFTFVTLTLENSEKKRFQLQKCFKIMWHPLEIPRSKTKTHGNSAWFFPDHPWKLDFFFNWPPEFSHVPYSVLLELPYPQLPTPPPPIWILFGVAQY